MYKFINNNVYIAVIGDIVQSKKLEDRDLIQQEFKKTLNTINKNYSDDIVSNFGIVYGDGFQGLLKINSNVMNIVSEIERRMYPTKIRFGIGIGELSTKINSSVYEIDGECFHFARAMLEEIVKNDSKHTNVETNIMIDSGEQNEKIDNLLNTILNLSYSIKKHWTSKQVNIINTYIKMNEVQSDTAKKLGVNKSTISKSLLSSDYYAYRNAINTVSKAIYIGEENYDSR